jgi:hypothetical protein
MSLEKYVEILEKKGRYYMIDFYLVDKKRCREGTPVLESFLSDDTKWTKAALQDGVKPEEINEFLEKYKVFALWYDAKYKNKSFSYPLHYAVPRGSKYKIKGAI